MQKISSLTLIALICFSSCGQAEQSVLNFDKISLNIDRASAANCVDEICKSISMKISVTNSSTQPVCTSDRYTTRSIFWYSTLLSDENEVLNERFQKMTFGADPEPDLPGNYANHVGFLEKTTRTIFIRPNSTFTYDVITPEIYELTSSKIHIRLKYFLYSCQNGSDNFKILSDQAVVSFGEDQFSSKTKNKAWSELNPFFEIGQ